MKRNLKTVKEMAAGGTFSADQLRWMLRQADRNGLNSAVCRIGSRIWIDVDAFDAWLVAQNPALNAKAGAA
ncbi:MAG: DNA-binding protein [Rubrivivax sp.]|nr:MAG: DNA-binding protein [Rubrivivax sp.]